MSATANDATAREEAAEKESRMADRVTVMANVAPEIDAMLPQESRAPATNSEVLTRVENGVADEEDRDLARDDVVADNEDDPDNDSDNDGSEEDTTPDEGDSAMTASVATAEDDGDNTDDSGDSEGTDEDNTEDDSTNE